MNKPMNVAQKVIKSHLVKGEMIPGREIAIRIDHTLTQDSTGTMAYLQFESMGVPRVRTQRSLAFIDHNTIQSGFENADDHKYIQTVAKKYGVYCSKPGNGICHQVELERFAVPGKTLLGSDSHTPTAGGAGMLAIGAGGLDVAVAMAGGEYYLPMPEVFNVVLMGRLNKGVSAKDIILEVLRNLSVKGGVGRIIEYSGDGLEVLTVPERATITNMGAELGATTSIFPSDENTREFLKAQGREEDFVELVAEDGCEYDNMIEIDLGNLKPLVACPHSPDSVVALSELAGEKVEQVCIGSCTNSSYLDLMKVSRILKGKTIAENTSLVISPGSKQVMTMLAKNGALADMIDAGARILESACGPCIGMGQSPASGATSLRSFNRNFYSRSGTASANVYLASPETCAISAINGKFVDPSTNEDVLALDLDIEQPKAFDINDNLIVHPADEKSAEHIVVVRGPNIKPFPINIAMPEIVSGNVLLKMEDNITTDHIMPSNSKLLPFRSNIPHLSKFSFEPVDPSFPERAEKAGGGFLVAGDNYGQGSSREHAALVPLYLGVRAVIAKSFARIHMANLINSGIIPLTFVYEADYDAIKLGDEIVLEDAVAQLNKSNTVIAKVNGNAVELNIDISDRLKEILIAGGLLNYTKSKA